MLAAAVVAPRAVPFPIKKAAAGPVEDVERVEDHRSAVRAFRWRHKP